MKSKFFLSAVLGALAAAFVLPLFSCSNASNDVGSGLVSFYVDKALVNKAAKLSANVSKDPTNDPVEEEEFERKFRFEVTLEGEYSETKTAYASFKEEPYTEDPTGDEPYQEEQNYNFDSFSIDFDVPVGKVVWAKIKIYEESEQERDEPVNERREPLLYGKSQSLKVSSGTNLLSVGAYSYRTYVPYKFTIQFDQEPDFSTCSFNRICAVDPASKFVAKLKAAKDDVDRYEACNQFEEKYSEDCWLGEMNLNYDAELSYSADGKTVTADGDMWMYVSEDDPASRAATALFVLICQNYSGKTKYYGMASSAVTPMKKPQNMASFSAQKLIVVDTKYALYNGTSDYAINYYLKDSPDEVLGDRSFFSVGTSDDMSPYEIQQSFCFDADGNFYTLSVQPDGGDVYIYSTNTTVNGYVCKDTSENRMPFSSISCDLRNNELFALKYDGGSDYILYGTGDFIRTGTNELNAYALQMDPSVPVAEFSLYRDFFAIYDNTAYFIISTGSDYYLYKANLNNASSSSVILEKVMDISLPSGVGYVNFTDMLYQNGAIYILGRSQDLGSDSSGEGYQVIFGPSGSITSRGFLIKYDIDKGSTKTVGWTDTSLTAASSKFYACNSQDEYGAFCTVQNYKRENFFTYNVSADKLPAIYAPSSNSKAFYGPRRFIAIKPKKLVIADDGMAFYTDKTSGAFCCKNANRVVTVDLENFAISSSDSTTAFFDGQETFGVYSNNYVNEAYTVSSCLYYGWYNSGSDEFEWYGPAESGSTVSLYAGIPLVEE